MADRTRISDLDFVYISFREPNKEENWADLKNKVPWAKRVDGVVGFDNAHKAAAELAETDFFISVDGDNIIDEKFLLETLDFSLTDKNSVHRWRAYNNVNGLVYGNGGLVGWSKETCLDMKTHENADNDENQIDFCWGVPHENLQNCYSTTVINATPQQAFETTLALNNKYFIDGRDPNSYANVAWCYGLHDRAWTERPVFGKIRYMNAKGLNRKFKMEKYTEFVDRLVRIEKT